MTGTSSSSPTSMKAINLGGYKAVGQVQELSTDGNKIEVNDEGDPELDDPSVDRET
jgi:hypothetical protein